MEEKIKALKEQMEAALGSVESKEQLGEFWQNFLGKKGSIADLMKGLGSVPKEERPNVGKTINEFKNQVEARYQEMKNKMDELELAARNKSEQVDITMPAKMRPAGGLHPLTVTENEMIDVFAGMGFEIYDGPEIEDDDLYKIKRCKEPSGKRYAGYLLCSGRYLAPYPHKPGTDPCHGREEAADQDAGTGTCIPFRQ